MRLYQHRQVNLRTAVYPALMFAKEMGASSRNGNSHLLGDPGLSAVLAASPAAGCPSWHRGERASFVQLRDLYRDPDLYREKAGFQTRASVATAAAGDRGVVSDGGGEKVTSDPARGQSGGMLVPRAVGEGKAANSSVEACQHRRNC